ncbi:MAG TPA: hypothetical protein PKY77_26485 [Phycisphaerae bacterium]|nr:hypothetical protein [Phycisphaerae bacterium]HSA30081.1 hypothetical protein [Phycisphaerae bacterium]
MEVEQEPLDIVSQAFCMAAAVERFMQQARVFYYAVILSGYSCPGCGGNLEMVSEGTSQCRSCGSCFDPTVTFQRCESCGGKPRLMVRRYQCGNCGQDVTSRFLFDGLVFDAEYFRQKMAESRERKRELRKRVRLMLPARTRLVENEAYQQLKAAMELEAFRYLQRRGHHRLAYKEYLRARELDTNLPEAEPVFRVGLLGNGDPPEPVEVRMPDGFPLSGCYRMNPDPNLGVETDEANTHLLAALGTFKQPFVPVGIDRDYLDYRWAKLPTIGKVEVSVGKKLQESWLWSGNLVCVDAITVTAQTSDGRSWSSPLCLAIRPRAKEGNPPWLEHDVLVTPEAQGRLQASAIWHHLGGWNEDGDSYETQDGEFSQGLNRFWAQLVGPNEQLRRDLMTAAEGIRPKWKAVTVSANGEVRIQFKSGKMKVVRPPVT